MSLLVAFIAGALAFVGGGTVVLYRAVEGLPVNGSLLVACVGLALGGFVADRVFEQVQP